MEIDLKPNVVNYAMHLKNTCSDRELHSLVGSIFPDEEVMEKWNLTEDDYFTAIEVVYFAPETINERIH